MKTIGFQDIAGGSIQIYSSPKIDKMPRHERIAAALKDLQHTSNIRIFLIKGKKMHAHKRILIKRY